MRRFISSLTLLGMISASLIYSQEIKKEETQGRLTKLNYVPKPTQSLVLTPVNYSLQSAQTTDFHLFLTTDQSPVN